MKSAPIFDEVEVEDDTSIKNKDLHKNETEAYTAGFLNDAENFFLRNFNRKNITLVQKLIKLYNFYNNTTFKNYQYLTEIEQKIQAAHLPLTTFPLEPIPHKMDKTKAEKFIAQFTRGECQETARKIINDGYITYFSFQDFENSLYRSILKFQQHLLINNIDPNSLSVFIEMGHSSQWVASLVLKYLNFCPKKCGEIVENTFILDKSYLENGTHNFVLFDDWSISGNQLHTYMSRLENTIKKAQGVKLNVICVIPLMTIHAFKSLKQYNSGNISLKIITDKFVPTLQSIKSNLAPKDAKNFDEILKESFGSSNRVLCWSDWKKPDTLSMPFAFSEGSIPFDLTPYAGMRVAKLPPGVNGNKFIPDPKSPYRK